MPMIMGSHRKSRFKRLTEEFVNSAQVRPSDKAFVRVGERSVAAVTSSSPGLIAWFNGRSVWGISSPALDGEASKTLHHHASHTLPHTERAASMIATKDEVVLYLAKREAQRILEKPAPVDPQS